MEKKLKHYCKSKNNTFIRYNANLKRNLPSSPYFTASDMASIYGHTLSYNNNACKIAIISLGGTFSAADAKNNWVNLCGIPAANIPKITTIQVNGNVPKSDPSGSNIENDLDIQAAGAWCPGSKTSIRFYSCRNSIRDFLLGIRQAVNDNVNVISISWGAPESFFGSARAQYDAVFQQAAAKNITVCVASGDGGSSNGTTSLAVDYPASSPFVLACGGSTLSCPTKNYNDPTTLESAWKYGGGGISLYGILPSWQKNIVQANYPGTLRRAVPDIALNADPTTGVFIFSGGIKYTVGGTSIVSPFMAGYIATFSTKKFIVPYLYANAVSNYFNDIIIGSNATHTDPTKYVTQKGYDCATGLGSCKLDMLKTYIMTN